LALNAILIIFIEVPFNVAIAKWPHHRALALGAFLVAAGLGLMAFVNNLAMAALSVVIWTWGEMILFPRGPTVVAGWIEPERQGEAMGLYTATFGLAFVLAPALGTWGMDRFGARVVWIATFIVGTAASLLYLRLRPATHLEPAGR